MPSCSFLTKDLEKATKSIHCTGLQSHYRVPEPGKVFTINVKVRFHNKVLDGRKMQACVRQYDQVKKTTWVVESPSFNYVSEPVYVRNGSAFFHIKATRKTENVKLEHWKAIILFQDVISQKFFAATTGFHLEVQKTPPNMPLPTPPSQIPYLWVTEPTPWPVYFQSRYDLLCAQQHPLISQ